MHIKPRIIILMILFGDKYFSLLVIITKAPGIKKQIMEQKKPPKIAIYDKISSKIAPMKVARNKTGNVTKKFLLLSITSVLKANIKKEALNEL